VVLWVRELLFRNDILKRKAFKFAFRRLSLRDWFIIFNFLEYFENLLTVRYQGGVLRENPGDCFFCRFWEAEDVVIWMLLPFLTLFFTLWNFYKIRLYLDLL
jgi:hypothetical protein